MKYFIILFTFCFLSCKKDQDEPATTPGTNLSSTIEYKQINGVDSNLLSLDIYYNSITETKKPIVIWVHGGAWSIGDKTSQIENKIALFQTLNYVFISVNYRLSPFPNEINNPSRIMYPMHNYDIADAIKWVVDNASTYGGNTNKIAIMGHSAGAHLVSLTATNNSFITNVGLNFSNIKGVASIDTEGYNVLNKIKENDNYYINAFGKDSILNVQASPIFNVKTGTYPKFFIAKRGNTARLKIANDFIDSLVAKGVTVSQIDGSIYTHSGINNAIGDANETIITTPLKAFFEDCFN